MTGDSGAGCRPQRAECLHVVPVAVGLHDRFERVAAQEVEDPLRLEGRVNQHRATGLGAPEEVDVVLVGADSHLGHPQARQLQCLPGRGHRRQLGVRRERVPR